MNGAPLDRLEDSPSPPGTGSLAPSSGVPAPAKNSHKKKGLTPEQLREHERRKKASNRAVQRIERKRLAKADALKRRAAALEAEEELEKLETYVAERTEAPTLAATPPVEAAPPVPAAPPPPPVRPGWPTDEQIAESAGLANALVMTFGVLCKMTLGADVLAERIKVAVRGADGVRKLVEVDAYAALTEATAPVLAKYAASMSDTPEAALGTVAFALLAPHVVPKLAAFAMAKFPQLGAMLATATAPAGRKPLSAVPTMRAEQSVQ